MHSISVQVTINKCAKERCIWNPYHKILRKYQDSFSVNFMNVDLINTCNCKTSTNIILFYSWDGVRVSPFILQLQSGLLCQLLMIDIRMEHWWNDNWQVTTEVLRQKPFSVPLCLWQILHGLSWGWTWASVVRSQQLTTRTVTQTDLTLILKCWFLFKEC